ncbi:MAG: hypothetical protein L0I76_36215 [Pseudonocardia sp.]|nr:hypothetical protein [Pseudonocardia sp.]MDN5920486.1 hypothetical protein [Pseudonocardia sp.]
MIEDYTPSAGTIYDGQGNYLKIGYYRSGDIGQEGTLVHDDWVVGTTPESVGPLRSMKRDALSRSPRGGRSLVVGGVSSVFSW